VNHTPPLDREILPIPENEPTSGDSLVISDVSVAFSGASESAQAPPERAAFRANAQTQLELVPTPAYLLRSKPRRIAEPGWHPPTRKRCLNRNPRLADIAQPVLRVAIQASPSFGALN
jgi:hypothetical protein